MKLRILLSTLLIIMFSAGISNSANADPWRHVRYGYCRPVVRYCPPPVRVYVAPPVYAYCRPHYYEPVRYAAPCYRERHYYRRGCRY